MKHLKFSCVQLFDLFASSAHMSLDLHSTVFGHLHLCVCVVGGGGGGGREEGREGGRHVCEWRPMLRPVIRRVNMSLIILTQLYRGFKQL